MRVKSIGGVRRGGGWGGDSKKCLLYFDFFIDLPFRDPFTQLEHERQIKENELEAKKAEMEKVGVLSFYLILIPFLSLFFCLFFFIFCYCCTITTIHFIAFFLYLLLFFHCILLNGIWHTANTIMIKKFRSYRYLKIITFIPQKNLLID